jgi:uncharacterized lipoprotein
MPRAALLVLLAATLAGCFFGGKDEDACVSVEEYQDAKAAPEISVPAGLDRPDESTRLNVPTGPEPVEPLSQKAACLQWPPDYFDKPLTKSSPEN